MKQLRRQLEEANKKYDDYIVKESLQKGKRTGPVGCERCELWRKDLMKERELKKELEKGSEAELERRRKLKREPEEGTCRWILKELDRNLKLEEELGERI